MDTGQQQQQQQQQQQHAGYIIESWELLFHSQDTETDFKDMPILTDMRATAMSNKIQVNGNKTSLIPASAPVPVPVIDLDPETDLELDMTAAVEPSPTFDSGIEEEKLSIQLKCVGCGNHFFKETFLENTEDHGFEVSLVHLHPKCDTCRTDLFPGKSTFRMGMKLKRSRSGNNGKNQCSEGGGRPSATIIIPAAAATLAGSKKGRKSKEAKTGAQTQTTLFNLEPQDFQVTLYPEDPALEIANKMKIQNIAREFMKRMRLESSILQNGVKVDENFNYAKYSKRKNNTF